MIIDPGFFFGPLEIEGVWTHTGADRTREAINGGFKKYMELYEYRYLCKLLGNVAALDFVGYLKGMEAGDTVADKWEGLLKVLVPCDKVSPIANYVFFYYVRRNQLRATPLGTTKANSDNEVVSCDALLVQAWNDMVDMNRDVVCFLERNRDEYGVAPASHELLEKINVLGI